MAFDVKKPLRLLALTLVIITKGLDASPQPDCLSVFCDLLVWHSAESGADNWTQVFVGSNTPQETVSIRDVPFDWDVGVRVGVERSQCDFLLRLYYTWFATEAKDGVQTTGSVTSSFLGNFYINNPTREIGPSYRGARIEWSIDLNMFDLEISRPFCAGRWLALRPSIGLKGGWIDQTIRSTWIDPITNPGEEFDQGTEDLRNDFWGIGPVVGIKSSWLIPACPLSLVGEFSGALMVGHWHFSDLYQNDQPSTVDVVLQDVNSVATMLRGFLGLEWDVAPRRVSCHFSVRLGYEAQFWFDQLQFYSLNTGRMNNLLTLQGGTFGITFYY